MTTINVLDEKKVVACTVVTDERHRPGADITYVMPQGYLASASWRLMFIREALDLCDNRTFAQVCRLVDMPGEEYDWSFIRDADSETLSAVAAALYYNVGEKMKALGLTSVTKFRKEA